MAEEETLQTTLDESEFALHPDSGRIHLLVEDDEHIAVRDVTKEVLEIAATYLLQAGGAPAVGQLLVDEKTGKTIELLARIRSDILADRGDTWQ